jgi:hypothetical protein
MGSSGERAEFSIGSQRRRYRFASMPRQTTGIHPYRQIVSLAIRRGTLAGLSTSVDLPVPGRL